MKRARAAVAALFLAALPAASEIAATGELTPLPADVGMASYQPPSRTFLCEIPRGWQGFEAETPRGIASHLIGPELADGGWRAAYHIHYFEKGAYGYVSARELLKVEREKNKTMSRQVTPTVTWRVHRKPARIFEVREKRVSPFGRLPAERIDLHHFYAVVPNGRDAYFMIKLSVTEKSYLKYREEFRRFLKSFRITSY